MKTKKEKCPRVLVGKSWLPVVHAFVYHETGTILYVGSLDRIKTYLENKKTCHGNILWYNKGRIYARRWYLFGKMSDQNGVTYSLIRTNTYKRFLQFRTVPKGMTETRNTWYLLRNEGQGVEVVKKWRKLPTSYLNLTSVIESHNKTKKVARYFTHRSGSFCDANYIVVNPDDSAFIVRGYNDKRPWSKSSWSSKKSNLEACLGQTMWKEITEAEAKHMTPKN